MKIFITGSTGFIGSHLAEKLLETEHELFCLIRKGNDKKKHELNELGAKTFEGDVREKCTIIKGMEGCDCVINLANLYSFWQKNKSEYTKVNVNGTKNVMECVLEAGVPKVIHVSTVVIYGKPGDSPFIEESTVGNIRFSEYARTKYKGDLIAWDLYKKKKLPLVMIYPAAVLGPGDTKDSGEHIKNMIECKLLRLNVFKKSNLVFVDVNDVVEAVIKAVEKENNIGEKYIIGKHKLTVEEFNRRILNLINGSFFINLPNMVSALLPYIAMIYTQYFFDIIKIRPFKGFSYDKLRTMKEGFWCDGSKAEKELGFTYTDINKTIKEAVEWIQTNVV